ncbi:MULTISPECIES: site-specific DNA-methyltransferase [Rhizobium]|uniref:site-specific DNA-methyltransferase n=1 Tax=Rhizobium TaxID=379 RepID=UPI001030F35A|nr:MULTISPECIES: DNA methyltransferase [Rhizobium]MBY5483247.1 site-specific DNA-methyltransferase [Rhizobium leguminosarum]NKL64991.1 site-specific DNA-methyltransferase [Rhizobium leguminosarum bv. viciae]TBA81185.1 site-specific DNA-methyltransferase [Rhizobium ruizarguesonis]TBZ64517.1 site-specific DNA-methyltransferase [Rhizobium leguminosarum bv. viciae]
MAQDSLSGASIYQHKQESVQRPDVGVEAQFSNKKAAKSYRYDSSLSPELSWDESADRAFAEWLLALIAEAAEKGEAVIFAEPQIWRGTEERFTSLSQCAVRLRSLTKPFLNWAGKAERQQVTVPTLPLFVHERHSTQAILDTLKSHKALGTNLDLFGDVNLDIADKLDAYQHKGPWTNRLILGDSLQVMNSLLEYEGMGGQVQMIYFDPPYGVKFGSNFQPFVRKTSVKHGLDEEMIREPEMVKAYRDTWELGLHSYLTYLRDRLLIAKEVLAPSGSIFVQISEENVHHVRELMEEVFGSQNACPMIVFQKTTGAGSPSGGTELPPVVNDYLLWYAKDRARMKYTEAYREKVRGGPGATQYDWIEIDGMRRKATDAELNDPPKGSRFFAHDNLTSQSGGPTTQFPVEFEGRTFFPAKGGWKTNEAGMRNLRKENRLFVVGETLRYVRYLDDFPYSIINNLWTDTVISGFGDPKIYVVRTSKKVVERCMLMVTDPSDLVLDITCGSGTTAVVAEQWGRRWITCDTSRVPIALARQRLLTSNFPWYQLKEPKQGPAGGFVYQRKRNKQGVEAGGLVPKITLQSIATNEDAGSRIISDKPEISRGITRVCGPFTVEATIQAAMSLEEDSPQQVSQTQSSSPRAYLDRMIEVLRQSKTLRLPGNVTLELETVSPLADREYLHAEGVARNGTDKRIAFVFGPEDGAIGSEYVFNAHTEALQQGYQQLFLFGFAIQAKAREMLDRLKIPTVYVSVTPDVVMSDLLKTSKASEIFSITGLPDVHPQPAGKRDDGTPLHRVIIKGLDIFRPDTMETDEIKADNLPCWMLDTNYNGMVFLASQVFFPKTSAWDNLQKSLKGKFVESVWKHLAGTVSEPFILGDKKRIAVKAIDERGNELMVVKSVEEGR